MSEGIVYILTNAAMPGYIKIGLTQQNDVALRVKQLDNTSLPLPFECYYSARVVAIVACGSSCGKTHPRVLIERVEMAFCLWLPGKR